MAQGRNPNDGADAALLVLILGINAMCFTAGTSTNRVPYISGLVKASWPGPSGKTAPLHY